VRFGVLALQASGCMYTSTVLGVHTPGKGVDSACVNTVEQSRLIDGPGHR
jgi:hypothetical protein